MSVTEIGLVADPESTVPAAFFMLSVPEVSETVSARVDEMPVSARVTPLTTTALPAVTDSVEGSVRVMEAAAGSGLVDVPALGSQPLPGAVSDHQRLLEFSCQTAPFT